jgi:PAS domain S-box-containing protein
MGNKKQSAWWERWLAAGALALIVGMVASAVYDASRTYREVEQRAVASNVALARVLAEQARRSMQEVDLVLRQVADAYTKHELPPVGSAQLHDYLVFQKNQISDVSAVLMIDTQGNRVATSTVHPPTPMNFKHRDFWQPLAEGRHRGLYLSSVSRSVIDGSWIMAFARRLEDKGGHFGGLVGATVNVTHFDRFYQEAGLEPGTVVTLLHDDGKLVARFPAEDSARGVVFGELAAFIKADKNERPARLVSPIDGVERFAALSRVQGYPLTLVVTTDVARELAPWREQTVGVAVRTTVLCLLTLLLLALVRVQLRRLQIAQGRAVASEQRYALAMRGADEGLWEWQAEGDRLYFSPRARQLLGLPDNDYFLRDELRHVIRVHPDDDAGRERAMRDHIAGRSDRYVSEYRVLCADGRYQWVHDAGIVQRDDAGRILRMAGSISSIDAQRIAEDRLRRQAELLDLTHDTIFVRDRQNRILYWNRGAERMYGFTRDEALGKDPDILLQTQFPDDRSAIDAELLRDGRWEGELTHRDRSGREIVVASRWSLRRDSDGKPDGALEINNDITQRRHAVRQLEASEQRYRQLVETAEEGIVIVDPLGVVTYANSRAAALLQMRVEQLVGSHARDLLHDPRAMDVDAELDRRAAGQADRGELALRRSDGTALWVMWSATGIFSPSGAFEGVLALITDITERRRAEEALRVSEERYALAVAGANEGLWDWDLHEDLVFFSPRAQLLCGLPAGSPLQTRQRWLERVPIHPDDIPRVRTALTTHLRGHAPFFEVEMRVQRQSAEGRPVQDDAAEWIWVRQRGVAVRDPEGRPLRMAGSVEDITERKRVEAERERLQAQLRQSQKLEAMGTLAGGIAHDFNNILGAIVGFSEMARKDATDGSGLAKQLDGVLRASQRAKSLVDRILAFSRSSVGERVPVHVQSVVIEALEQFQASSVKNVSVRRSLDAGDAAVMGDQTQIHQVVMNLVTNAMHAMPTGGVIEVDLDVMHSPTVTSTSTGALPPGHYVRLRVSDHGSGMDGAILERIFDPFFTTRGVGVGTGLGLSLVHGIVTDLGGGIDVLSAPGKGSTFVVYLPWRGTATEAIAPPETLQLGRGQTVLIVDDEEPLVRIGEEAISALGYEPVGYTSSEAALIAFRNNPGRFDAVLSDETMPGLTGSQLAAEIRKLRPDIPIILMSGFVGPAIAANARAARVNDVLAKPLTSREIARALANVLS